MIISWVKQHLEWKWNDHWKNSATKYNDRLDMVIHEQYTARVAEAEMLLYYKDLLMIINKLSTTCDDLLKIKLVEDVPWQAIYLRYPNENKGSLRVKFSNMIKTLREILLSDSHF
jgi:septum formation topological specificity factor MinE